MHGETVKYFLTLICFPKRLPQPFVVTKNKHNIVPSLKTSWGKVTYSNN